MPNVKTLGILFVLTAVGSLAFLFKPLHADDPLYLGVTQRILQNPANPFADGFVWGEGDWFQHPNPPLWSYILATGVLLFGWNILALHWIQMLCYFGLAWGIYHIFARQTAWPALWTACVLWSPWLLPGVNLMLEVPMLCLVIWSLAFWLPTNSRTENHRRAAWSGLLLGLAILTKYTAILFVPVLLVSILPQIRTEWRRLLCLLLPICLLLSLWIGHNFLWYGRSHLGAQGIEIPGAQLDRFFYERFFVTFRVLGSVAWLSPILSWALLTGAASASQRSRPLFSRWWLLPIGVLAGTVGILDGQFIYQEASQGQLIIHPARFLHTLIFSANGILFLFCLGIGLLRYGSNPAEIAKSILKLQRDDGAMANDTLWRIGIGWLAVGLIFHLLMVPSVSFGAVRHLLFILTPAHLLLFPLLEQWAREGISRKIILAGHFVLYFSLTIGLAHADFVLASSYAQTGQNYLRQLQQLQPQQEVWCVCDPAFEYYVRQTGCKIWRPSQPDIPIGAWLVVPRLQMAGLEGHALRQRLVPLPAHALVIDSVNSIRTVAPNVNYYGGNVVTLPWNVAFESEDGWHLQYNPPVELFTVGQVRE